MKTDHKRNILNRLLSLCLLCAVALTAEARAVAAPAVPPEAQAAYDDMQKTLGVVPSFFKAFPVDAVGPAWDEFKNLQLNPKTAIPNKYKELIGLAVAAQIPCQYCIYFHTKAAELGGASSREVSEIVALASLTRQWSTVLNGQQTDEAQFQRDFGRILSYVKQPARKQTAIAVVDADSAYRDIEQTLGVVLPMFRSFPRPAIAGAWKAYKAIELNPKTAVPNKYKELAGLGVASQIPCRYCTYFHTEAAKLNGATDAEVQEAIAMAAITRHWSTFLNGMQIDEQVFRRETDQAVNYVRQKSHVASR